MKKTWTDPTFKIQHVENYGIITAISGQNSTVTFRGQEYQCRNLVKAPTVGVGSQVKLITGLNGVNTWIPKEFPFRPAYPLHVSSLKKKCPAAATVAYFLRNNRKKYDFRIGRISALWNNGMVVVTRPNNSVRVVPVWRPAGETGTFSVNDSALIYKYDDGREVAILGGDTGGEFEIYLKAFLIFSVYAGQTSRTDAGAFTYGTPAAVELKVSPSGVITFPGFATYIIEQGINRYFATEVMGFNSSFFPFGVPATRDDYYFFVGVGFGTATNGDDTEAHLRISAITCNVQGIKHSLDAIPEPNQWKTSIPWINEDSCWGVNLGKLPTPVMPDGYNANFGTPSPYVLGYSNFHLKVEF